MRKYISPEIETIKFDTVDVIETSSGGGLENAGDGNNETDEPMEWGFRRSMFN